MATFNSPELEENLAEIIYNNIIHIYHLKYNTKEKKQYQYQKLHLISLPIALQTNNQMIKKTKWPP